ncbi:MAG: FlgD immunoglobulin-like domain containing protein, partial [Bacteroidota bacterium]|nr:FlgD immunoglobulin-like domain containing protein [Bacteroidota bacterium]
GLPGAGNILAFNNNNRGRASAVVELVPPLDGGGRFNPPAPGAAWDPPAPLWSYSAGSSFFTAHYGGNQRLPNGNTLVTESTKGSLFEVAPDGRIVWEYRHGREIARALRYGYDDPAVSRLRTSHAEDDPLPAPVYLAVAPNPARAGTGIRFRTVRGAVARVTIADMLGREVRTLHEGANPAGEGYVWWDGRDSRGAVAGSGVYFCVLRCLGRAALVKPVVLE